MSFTFRPAKRLNTPLIIGLAGPTKSGKTYSAHRIAQGLADGGQVAMINAEGAKGHQYADEFDYIATDISRPYRPERYTEALRAVLELAPRPSVVIIDSMSHMHDGPGGLLEYHSDELDRMAGNDFKKRDRMNWTAWIKPKAAENEFIYTMLEADCHLILCFRAKEKIKIVKGADPIPLGWQPIAGERIAFETIFTLTLPPHCKGVPDLAISDMRKPFDSLIPTGHALDEATGKKLAAWASGGSAPADPTSRTDTTSPLEDAQRQGADVLASQPQRRLIFARAKEAGVDESGLKAIFETHTGQTSSSQIPADRVEAILAAILAATPEPGESQFRAPEGALG